MKLLDFGISKMLEPDAERLTRAGSTLGTPHYMALEQFMSARDVNGRADLYALGVVMYEMVSGALPFDAESFEGMAVTLATETPRPLGQVAPHCPAAFLQIVERALALDRDARFASASAMALALKSVRGGGAMMGATGTQPVPRAQAAAPSVALTPPAPWGLSTRRARPRSPPRLRRRGHRTRPRRVLRHPRRLPARRLPRAPPRRPTPRLRPARAKRP